MRPLLLRLHRWFGVCLALFLVVAGATGAILVYRPEINRWLNPEYSVTPQPGPMLDPFQLRERALALVPGSRINSMPLHVEPGDAYVVSPQSKGGDVLGFSALILNPYTGEEIHRVRETGLWPVSRHNFLAFADALHNRLALGPLGRWLSGAAALAFLCDCFIALYLALTPPARPAKSLAFRLHRGAGLFLWPVLLTAAASSVAMSLPADVYVPFMRSLFPGEAFFHPLPRLPQPRPEPGLGWREARETGRKLMEQQAAARGFNVLHEGRLGYFPEEGTFVYTVYTDREIIRRGTFTAVYFDGVNGAMTLATAPRGEGPGASFTLWLMALHAGDAVWAPMRFLASGAGLALVFISVSGIYLWRSSPPSPRSARRKARQGRRPGR